MIAIVDYDAGNIKSLKNALDYLKIENILTNKPEEINSADKVILPGVGAFPAAVESLKKYQLIEPLKKAALEKPFLGICLGMQLLFDESYEFSKTSGLGFIAGKVDFLEDKNVIIPHMGWNRLEINHDCKLLDGIGEAYVYFVHSYRAQCKNDENLMAYSEYGTMKVPALVSDNKYVYGTQFHPEKSGETGLKILRNFGALK